MKSITNQLVPHKFKTTMIIATVTGKSASLLEKRSSAGNPLFQLHSIKNLFLSAIKSSSHDISISVTFPFSTSPVMKNTPTHLFLVFH